MSDFKWRHFEGEIILWAVRWYCRYGIGYRDLERDVLLGHSTVYRGVQKYAPEIEKRLRWQWRRPGSVANSAKNYGDPRLPCRRELCCKVQAWSEGHCQRYLA